MSRNPSQMEELVTQVDNLATGRQNVNLSMYDFASLAGTIKYESFWVVQLEHMGMVDRSNQAIDPSKESTTSGIRSSFMIYCYDDKGTYRTTQECVGLPDSNTLLQ